MCVRNIVSKSEVAAIVRGVEAREQKNCKDMKSEDPIASAVEKKSGSILKRAYGCEGKENIRLAT